MSRRKSMAWQTKSLRQICEQMKDPTRNGGKTLAAIQDHLAHDSLVGWHGFPAVFASLRPAHRRNLLP
jgi:hypothetical protein